MFSIYLFFALLVFGVSVWITIKQDKEQKEETKERDSIIEGLQKEIVKLKQETKPISQIVPPDNKEIEEVKLRLEQKTVSLEKVENALKEEKEINSKIHTSIIELQKNLKEKNEEIARIKPELNRLQNELNIAKDEIEKIKYSYAQLDGKLKGKEKEITELEKELVLVKQTAEKFNEQKPVDLTVKQDDKTVPEKLFQAKESSLKKIVKEVLEQEKSGFKPPIKEEQKPVSDSQKEANEQAPNQDKDPKPDEDRIQ